MKITSLRWKTVNILFALVALAFAIGLVLCAGFSTHYFVGLKQDALVKIYETLNAEGPEGDAEDEVFAICEQEGITLLVKDYAGDVVYSFGHSQTMSRRLDDITFGGGDTRDGRKIIESTPNYTLQSISKGEHGKNTYVEIWGFLNNGDSFIAQSSMQSIRNNTRISLAFFAVVCAVLLIISAVAIYFIIGYYSKPLARIAMTAQRMNEGDFAGANYEYRHFRQDEIGVLGESVREMGEKLEKNIAELKTSNLNLENELKAKTEQEEARKKYMSDVSHELKTPIALIAGYAEGLKEGIFESKEDQDYYCDVIIDEAEKMNVIIKRLSTLNQLEEGKSAVSLERFNVVDVINGFLNTMSVIIEDKDAIIYFDNRKIVRVWSDEFLFEEVLVNYFNNALNHLDENKIIRINVEKMDEKVRVTVFNSGENIPEEEINQIWGKFYKVDKARTREYGGSGLGLSIVKAVADSLHQECGVYNLPDGVAFWIDLEAAASSADDELPEEHTARIKLSELPIWKKTAERQQARKQRKEKEKMESREEKKNREEKKKEEKKNREEKKKEEKKNREEKKKEEKENREEKKKEEKKNREEKKKEEKETREEKKKEEKKNREEKKKEEKKKEKKELKNAADSE